MQAIKALRALVITEIALLAAFVVSTFIPQDPFPAAVDEYLEGPGAGPLFNALNEWPTFVLTGFLVLIVVAYVAALIGLLLLKPWSRRFYVGIVVAGMSMFPFFGASLARPLEGALEYLSAACSGAILALLFFSDARKRFEDSDA